MSYLLKYDGWRRIVEEEDPKKGKGVAWTRPVPDPLEWTGTNGIPEQNDLVHPDRGDGKGKYSAATRKLRRDAAAALGRADLEYFQETGRIFKPYWTDGFRTYQRQYEIVDWDHLKSTGDYRKTGSGGKTPVAQPGTSNHGTGIAIDIGGRHHPKGSDATPEEIRSSIPKDPKEQLPNEWLHGPSKLGLERRSEDFGWWWGEAPSENWHFKFLPELKKKADRIRLERKQEERHQRWQGLSIDNQYKRVVEPASTTRVDTRYVVSTPKDLGLDY